MEFIRSPKYLKALARMGASRDDIDRLENEIALFPDKGDLVAGMKGVRKIRFAIGKTGKRGGGRALYYLVVQENTALMITAYAKSKTSDLSGSDRREILEILESLDGKS